LIDGNIGGLWPIPLPLGLKWHKVYGMLSTLDLRFGHHMSLQAQFEIPLLKVPYVSKQLFRISVPL
jgi:hypothetical protein